MECKFSLVLKHKRTEDKRKLKYNLQNTGLTLFQHGKAVKDQKGEQSLPRLPETEAQMTKGLGVPK